MRIAERRCEKREIEERTREQNFFKREFKSNILEQRTAQKNIEVERPLEESIVFSVRLQIRSDQFYVCLQVMGDGRDLGL